MGRESRPLASMDDKDAELLLREAALSASPILQPDFKFSKVTQAQLDKFRELHSRRLHLKGKSKDKGRPKGKASQVVKTCTVLNEDDGNIKVTANNIEASNLSAANGKGEQIIQGGPFVQREPESTIWERPVSPVYDTYVEALPHFGWAESPLPDTPSDDAEYTDATQEEAVSLNVSIDILPPPVPSQAFPSKSISPGRPISSLPIAPYGRGRRGRGRVDNRSIWEKYTKAQRKDYKKMKSYYTPSPHIPIEESFIDTFPPPVNDPEATRVQEEIVARDKTEYEAAQNVISDKMESFISKLKEGKTKEDILKEDEMFFQASRCLMLKLIKLKILVFCFEGH